MSIMTKCKLDTKKMAGLPLYRKPGKKTFIIFDENGRCQAVTQGPITRSNACNALRSTFFHSWERNLPEEMKFHLKSGKEKGKFRQGINLLVAALKPGSSTLSDFENSINQEFSKFLMSKEDPFIVRQREMQAGG